MDNSGSNKQENPDSNKQSLKMIENLKSKLEEANNRIRHLEDTNLELSARITKYSGIEMKYKICLADLEKSKNKNKELVEEFNKNHEENLKKMRLKDAEYLSENKDLSSKVFTNQLKAVESDAKSVLLKEYEKRIEELEKEKNDLQEQKDQELRSMEIRHQSEYEELNKKMMDHIQASQKKMKQSNMENLDLNSKLSRLFTNQLLLELEEQSTQIETLLNSNEKFKKQIFTLKTDLNLHQKVENILGEKNKRYKKYIEKIDSKIVENNKNKPQINLVNGNFNDTSLQNQTTNLEPITMDSPKEKNLYLQKVKSNSNYTINTNKMLQNKDNEIKDLKDKLKFSKEKEKYFQRKYMDIIAIYQNAIDELVTDPSFKNIKEVNADITQIKEKIGKGDFGGLNKSEQYSVLVFLVKHLLPLINGMDPADDEIESQIQNINNKFDNIELNGTITSRFNSTAYSDKGLFFKANQKPRIDTWYGKGNKTFKGFYPNKKPDFLSTDRHSKLNKPSNLVRFLSFK